MFIGRVYSPGFLVGGIQEYAQKTPKKVVWVRKHPAGMTSLWLNLLVVNGSPHHFLR